MSGVRIVTDSGCDLTEELADVNSILVVPLTIRFGDEEFLDRRDLTPADFWKRCHSTAALPQTAAPSPGAFQEAYERAATEGADAVVCLTISSRVSATYQSALAGAASMAGRIPVEVVDTESVTMGQGLLCIAAAEAAAAGADTDAVVRTVRDLIGRTKVYGVVGTLDHLQRGGRIGGAAAMLGSLLSIKPVIQVRDGMVEEESKQRTRARALSYLAAKPRADAPLERLAVCNGAASDIDAVVSTLSDITVAHQLVVVNLGPVVGTHTGPETIGICYQLPPS
ncbi:MAG: DegV family protein [Actinomycetota bacterium]|jgi:DegV family protein with EDD domain|nr:DegV family protein [Actinomycetota bacterium]